MRKFIIFAIALFLSVLLQTTVLPRLAIFGARIDLVLLFAFTIAFVSEPEAGALFGFFGGLLLDLISGIPGLLALSNTLTSYFGGIVERNFKVQEKLLLTVSFGALITARQIIYGLSLFLAGLQISFPSFVTLIFTAIINSAVFFVLYEPFSLIIQSSPTSTLGSIDGRRTSSIKG